MRRYSAGIFVAMAVSALSAPGALASPPPVEAYASLPTAQDPRLSPDGEALAMVVPINGRPTLVVRRLNGAKATVVSTEDSLPDWFHWKTSNRLLASVRFMARWHEEPYAQTRLFFLDADGGNVVTLDLERDLAPGATVIGYAGQTIPQIQDRVISLLPNDPDHLLMSMNSLHDGLHPQVLKVNIHNGRPTVEQRSLPNVVGWLADSDGNVRLAMTRESKSLAERETHKTFMAKVMPDGDWQTIHESDVNQSAHFTPMGFVKGASNVLYVMADSENTRVSAHQYDIASHSFTATLAEDADCDAAAVMHDYQLVGFRTCRPGSLHYLDEHWQRDLDFAKTALKAEKVTILDRTADEKRVLLSVNQTANAPRAFWLLDRSGEKPAFRSLTRTYDTVPPEQIAKTQRLSYKARDGLVIPALVTLPVDHHGQAIPFVVLPHGGPTAHDDVAFDWMVQFLVSRGYGVLQPQFRGSTGYGSTFEHAGRQQWGRLMQDDVTDGTKWLIDQKLADPAKICIVGGSYGGYAALMGVIKEPSLYACAAAYAPVTDLDKLVTRIEISAFKDANLPRIKGENQSLDEVSPVEQAGKINVPVLLMHGRKDFTVPVEHSEIMERALKRAGKTVEATYLDDADHFFSTTGDRLAWLGGLDKFLAANLGAQTVGN